MIQEFEPQGSGPAGFEEPFLEPLRRLPQPLHLLEFVNGTQHYHFGCFEAPDESLRRAQDRMALLGACRFAPGSAILDIGCGLGGTSQLLASRGLRVTGIDPCGDRLAYASARAAGLRNAPRFLARTLEQHAQAGEAALDGALALEVLQHFPDLGRFFGACRRLLRPGATLVVHDLSTRIEVAWERVSFHCRGQARAAAEAAGFRRVDFTDRTAEVLPTLPILVRTLLSRRAELVRAFGPPGPAARPVEAELEELLAHVGALQSALELGDLAYETMVFEAQARGVE